MSDAREQLQRRWPDVLIKVGIIAACLWVLGTAARVTPDARGYGTHEQLGLATCGYFSATGRPCPSCGMTTSFSRMIRLDVVAAFRANPAGALLCLIVMGLPGYLIHSILTEAPALRALAGRRGTTAIFGAIAVVALSWWYKIASVTG